MVLLRGISMASMGIGLRNLLFCCRPSYFRFGFSRHQYCKIFLQFLGVILAIGLFIQLVIINVVFVYVFKTSIETAERFNEIPGSLLDKLQGIGFAKDLLKKGKNGGVKKLLELSVDRMYLMQVGQDFNPKTNNLPDIFQFGVDMSNGGEALYIYKLILRREKFPYSKLMVDIGANDGLLSSNSYNFIQWGWDAILVEPLQAQLDLAKKNTANYRDGGKRKTQRVTFVQALIGMKDGVENLVVSQDIASMESHIESADKDAKVERSSVIQVTSLTVKTFAQRYKVPKYFAILSVDAEGVSDKIVYEWMKLEYRPAYIIFEALHNKESIQDSAAFLATYNYNLLIKLGWNYIFEHARPPTSKEQQN